MAVYSMRQICKALDLATLRVHQWIHRGHFKVDEAPLGPLGRDWFLSDAVRLATFAELHDLLGGALAGMAADHADYEKPPGLYLVCVPYTSTLAPAGTWAFETVPRNQIQTFIRGRSLAKAVVVDLDQVVMRVKHALEDNSHEN